MHLLAQARAKTPNTAPNIAHSCRLSAVFDNVRGWSLIPTGSGQPGAASRPQPKAA